MMHFEMMTELQSHQIAATNKFKGLRVGALFMQMRTGKTLTTLELVNQRQHKISKVIWVCPVSAKADIAGQIKQHTSAMDVCVFKDSTTQSNLPNVSWYVIGMESISQSRRVKLCLHQLVDEKTCVILDESDLCANPFSGRSVWLTRICEIARYKFILTGTAALEGVEDLFSQMRFLDWRILGYKSYYTFAHNHLEYWDNGTRGGKPQVKHVLDKDGLARKIAPYTYQVTLEDIDQEPSKGFNQFGFELTKEQQHEYMAAKIRFSEIPDDQLRVWDVYRLFSELRAICCGFLPVAHLVEKNQEFVRAKYEFKHHRLEPLLRALQGLPEGEPVVIWATYQHSIEQIKAMLLEQLKIEALEFHGRIHPQRRNANIASWKNNGGVLLGTPYTGGRGLDFSRGSHAIFYANDWKTRVRVQAESRIIKMDARRQVNFIDIIAHNSIDQRIYDALSRKENAAKAFHDAIGKVKDKKFRQELIYKL